MKFNCLLVSVVILWQFVTCEDEEENISGPPVPPLVLKNSFCGLKQDEGSCKATIPRFYFNLFTRKCDYFEFGGCGGNENNFESMEECQEKCIIKEPRPPKKGRKINSQGMPEFCLQEEDPGICRGYITRYLYNANSKKCEKFIYGGCLGNRNNFISMDECRSTCENLAFLAADVSHPVQPHINRERENVNFSSNAPTAISKLPNISYQSQSKGSDIPTAMSKLASCKNIPPLLHSNQLHCFLIVK
ncbi:tissue factor pathway inhibitor isoform X2 [Bombina bombina]|uniref:tissue factor pathway inhibitor isoform X2 n=1 Tax=Bombina bombina TaxID=8345 RepID=UPI00235ABAFD|nr:tissue factor pathway inhibitor isoform X2 [Bombina bombina]